MFAFSDGNLVMIMEKIIWNLLLISGTLQLKITPYQRDIAKSAIANLGVLLAWAKTVNKPCRYLYTWKDERLLLVYLNKPNAAALQYEGIFYFWCRNLDRRIGVT